MRQEHARAHALSGLDAPGPGAAGRFLGAGGRSRGVLRAASAPGGDQRGAAPAGGVSGASARDRPLARMGRFLLTGSASPALLASASESLAGRVGLLELTPFRASQLAGMPQAESRRFARVGEPEAWRHRVRAKDNAGLTVAFRRRQDGDRRVCPAYCCTAASNACCGVWNGFITVTPLQVNPCWKSSLRSRRHF